jgi:hypothetical protein
VGNAELMKANGLGRVRVTSMNGNDRDRGSSCADLRVCPNGIINNRKKFLQRPASFEIALNRELGQFLHFINGLPALLPAIKRGGVLWAARDVVLP